MQTHIEKRRQTFHVRNQEITVLADALINDVNNEIVFDLNLDNHAIEMAYDQYRQKNHLITPEEIVAIRKKYHLSQRAFAKLLDVGSATIARYEKGALPAESMNNLLLNLKNDSSYVIKLFMQNKNKLSDYDRRRAEDSISKMTVQLKSESLLNSYIFRNQNDKSTLDDGFTEFNLEKLSNMVLYFTQENSNLSKTKLNKLLFYSDFRFFRDNSKAISGIVYTHDHHGPVPSDFELLYTILKDNGDVTTEPFADGRGSKFISLRDFDKAVFTNSEFSILQKVSKDFEGYDIEMMGEYSHQETAFQKTVLDEVISYQYALDLRD